MSAIGIDRVLELLPHRYPMLLVDRVLEVEPGVRLKALKNVSTNEPWFQGHFPDNPVMPGVLLLEGMAQASILLAYLSAPDGDRPLHLFAGVENARFKRLVRPGDQLVYEVTMGPARHGIWRASCAATVDGQLACKAELMSRTQAGKEPRG